MKKINRFLTNYFGITPREANGFLVLSGVIIFFLLVPIAFKSFFQSTSISSSDDKKLLDSLVAVLESERAEQIAQQVKSKKTNTFKKKENPPTKIRLFPFNPNTITEDEWMTLGVPKFIAKRVINYRNKGGEFRYKSDLMRIYDFPEPTYKSIKSYILLPEKQEIVINDTKGKINKDEPQKESNSLIEVENASLYDAPAIAPFEINSATQEELMQVHGIGEKLSARIINFRDKLGGFYNVEQVRATYGLDTTVCNELLEIASIDETNIKKVRINKAIEEDLKSHPYISYNLARVIVKYRQQHGNYTSVEDLKKIRILKTETLDKLTPYLSFE